MNSRMLTESKSVSCPWEANALRTTLSHGRASISSSETGLQLSSLTYSTVSASKRLKAQNVDVEKYAQLTRALPRGGEPT